MAVSAYKKDDNYEAWLAWQIISETSVNVFLTGKAGTGKTTFLKKLHEQSPKRMAIVAPTGVAAINAGGVTIHSFFQLPFSPYIPNTKFKTDFTMRKEKINIIRTLDMLVIDEISMVRADLLDAVDASLRHYRRNDAPFGGVQLVMIGDLQQLPPVVVDSERSLIESFYTSPYFFSSLALQKSQYVTIELKTVYRQNDLKFVGLLNSIRDNRIDQSVLSALNARYIPDFNPSDDEGYIRLTTHNSQADGVNASKLSDIASDPVSYECRVQGVFPESSYPADKTLTLKVGAQVMFIKNDKSQERRYYNGKIGVVTALRKDSVDVRCLSDDIVATVEYDEWTNAKYVIDKETNEISEQIDGEFSQIPLRLAWAVTIHKSQGLTFDKAIIDAQMSFAHGQVYVALSRCRTLEGLVLSSRISYESVISDNAVNSYLYNQTKMTPSESAVDQMKADYAVEMVKQLFDFRNITSSAYRIERIFDENLHKTFPRLLAELKAVLSIVNSEILDVADKFVAFCSFTRQQGADIRDDDELKNRIANGSKYFYTKCESLLMPLSNMVDVEIDNAAVKKQITDLLDVYNKDIKVKMTELKAVSENGFNVDAYLKTRANAIIDVEKKPAAAKKTKKVVVSDDVRHPRLYEKIVLWRRDKAEELNVPAYVVLSQKALVDIVNKLPENESQLKKVNGIGNVKLKQYGAELISMVNEYLDE